MMNITLTHTHKHSLSQFIKPFLLPSSVYMKLIPGNHTRAMKRLVHVVNSKEKDATYVAVKQWWILLIKTYN